MVWVILLGEWRVFLSLSLFLSHSPSLFLSLFYIFIDKCLVSRLYTIETRSADLTDFLSECFIYFSFSHFCFVLFWDGVFVFLLFSLSSISFNLSYSFPSFFLSFHSLSLFFRSLFLFLSSFTFTFGLTFLEKYQSLYPWSNGLNRITTALLQ